MTRRNAATSTLRRPVALRELYRLAGKIAARLSRDSDYRDDLRQEGVLAATDYQAKDPEAPSALLCKVIHRAMLQKLSRDRLNNREKNYAGPTLFLADVWATHAFEPGANDPAISEAIDRIANAQTVDRLLSCATPEQREVLLVMLENECGQAEAARILDLPDSTVKGRVNTFRSRALRLNPGLLAA